LFIVTSSDFTSIEENTHITKLSTLRLNPMFENIFFFSYFNLSKGVLCAFAFAKKHIKKKREAILIIRNEIKQVRRRRNSNRHVIYLIISREKDYSINRRIRSKGNVIYIYKKRIFCLRHF